MKKWLSIGILGAALLLTGYGIGMSTKVFISRGVPVTNGGGELLLLLAIPASVLVGFKWGRKVRGKFFNDN